MGKLENGEGIGGCCGGVEHGDGGAKRTKPAAVAGGESELQQLLLVRGRGLRICWWWGEEQPVQVVGGRGTTASCAVS